MRKIDQFWMFLYILASKLDTTARAPITAFVDKNTNPMIASSINTAILGPTDGPAGLAEQAYAYFLHQGPCPEFMQPYL